MRWKAMNGGKLDEVEGNEWVGTDTVVAISWWLLAKVTNQICSYFYM